jgi:hypothetical protein
MQPTWANDIEPLFCIHFPLSTLLTITYDYKAALIGTPFVFNVIIVEKEY